MATEDDEIRVRDRVERVKGEDHCGVKLGGIYLVRNIRSCKGRLGELQFKGSPDYLSWHPTNFKKVTNKNKTKDGEMNKAVIALFEKTADAVLVDKYLGVHILENPIMVLLLEGTQQDLVKIAKAKEAEESKRG